MVSHSFALFEDTRPTGQTSRARSRRAWGPWTGLARGGCSGELRVCVNSARWALDIGAVPRPTLGGHANLACAANGISLR